MLKKKSLIWLVYSILFLLIILSIGFLLLFYYNTPITKNTDNFIYELPFKKESEHAIVQGYGGLFSHNHIAALDFEMPIGTPIYAARGGTIFSYKDDSDEGGVLLKYKNKANYIIIKHDNGSFGCYWHLKKNGVLIKKGKVAIGEQIGLSGATGLVVKPHLHFSVKRILNYEMNSFVKTKFKTTKSDLFLENGKIYKSPKN